MTKDRLLELQKKAGIRSSTKSSPKDGADAADEGSSGLGEGTAFLTISKGWENVEEFLELVNKARNRLGEMETVIERIAKIHRKLLSEPGTNQAINEERNEAEATFKQLCLEVRSIATSLNAAVTQAGKQRDTGMRIKENQVMGINRHLRDLCTSFANEQNQYREKCQERITSYMRIAGVHMTPDQLEEAFDSGNFFSTVGVLTADREKKALFEDVRNRHEDILRLEASVRELHELFQDVFMLVETQGEMMNRIDYNISKATDHARDALYNVQCAKRAKRRNVKLKIALAICVVLLIIMLFGIGSAVFCTYLPFICR